MSFNITKIAPPHRLQYQWLLMLCRFGTILSFCILAASAGLRLTTIIDAEGIALSQIPSSMEPLIRIIHRISASVVALISLTVLILSWQTRRSSSLLIKPAVWLAASVVVLSIIGPLTSGYKSGVITVMNVVTGTIMLMAYWWISETILLTKNNHLHTESKTKYRHTWLIWVTLHIATGAAASAGYMYGMEWLYYLHLLTFLKLLWITIQKKKTSKQSPSTSIEAIVSNVLVVFQFVSGSVMIWHDNRGLFLSFMHAIFSYLLVLMTISVVVRKKLL